MKTLEEEILQVIFDTLSCREWSSISKSSSIVCSPNDYNATYINMIIYYNDGDYRTFRIFVENGCVVIYNFCMAIVFKVFVGDPDMLKAISAKILLEKSNYISLS